MVKEYRDLRRPAPPVTDCAKCSKLAELRRQVKQLEDADAARLAAAMAGVGVTLTDEEIEAAKRRAYYPQLDEVLAVPREVALDKDVPPSARLAASNTVADRVLGPVKQKLEHTGPNGAPLCTPTLLEVIVVGGSVAVNAKPQEPAT